MSPKAQETIAFVLVMAVLLGGLASAVYWLWLESGPSKSTPCPPPMQSTGQHLAHSAWLLRRDVEFAECDAAHGQPTLGFNGRVVCLRSTSVISVGEPSPE